MALLAQTRLSKVRTPVRHYTETLTDPSSVVSKAFQVLSDPQKRAAYDHSGSDPESRFSGASPSFASGGVSPFGEGEMSPEDLFNMFFGARGFGGDGFSNGFGGPGRKQLHTLYTLTWSAVFTASFGPNGFRTSSIHTRRRTRPNGEQTQEESTRSPLLNFLPLIVLFVFSLLNALPNIFTSPSIPDPRFSFTPTDRYNAERQTGGLGVKYHVNNVEFSNHPAIAADLKTPSTTRGKAISRFESTVERIYTQEKYAQCQHGLERRERRKEKEIGFGIRTDWEKVKSIEKETVESCEELRRLGVIS
jgi:DnaJ family protein B protein 12